VIDVSSLVVRHRAHLKVSGKGETARYIPLHLGGEHLGLSINSGSIPSISASGGINTASRVKKLVWFPSLQATQLLAAHGAW